MCMCQDPTRDDGTLAGCASLNKEHQGAELTAHQQRPRCSSSISGYILYRFGSGAATTAARRPLERSCTGGGSNTSTEKLTPRSSEELTTNPPAQRGFLNLSFRPGPYLTHPSLLTL
eukprot:7388788-Prymnesium_polylepis.1